MTARDEHRWKIEMLEYSTATVAELSRLLAVRRGREEALALQAMVEGRSAWMYDDGLDAQIADLREAVEAFRQVKWRK